MTKNTYSIYKNKYQLFCFQDEFKYLKSLKENSFDRLARKRFSYIGIFRKRPDRSGLGAEMYTSIIRLLLSPYPLLVHRLYYAI